MTRPDEIGKNLRRTVWEFAVLVFLLGLSLGFVVGFAVDHWLGP